MKNIISLLSILSLIYSCNSDNEVESEFNGVCDNTISDFKSIYNGLLANSNLEEVSMDTNTHEYTFTLTTQKEVCEIGYQSFPAIEDRPYIIEIHDTTNNILIYSDSHIFTSTNTSYITPNETVILNSNTLYSLRRIQNDWAPFVDNTVGRLLFLLESDLPYSFGDLTIISTNTNTENIGSIPDNVILPYIDIIFKE